MSVERGLVDGDDKVIGDIYTAVTRERECSDEDFVTRCYLVILGRRCSDDELGAHIQSMDNNGASRLDKVKKFVLFEEFKTNVLYYD